MDNMDRAHYIFVAIMVTIIGGLSLLVITEAKSEKARTEAIAK